MQLRNTSAGWGAVAKLLHWTVALLILIQLGHGWWMVTVMDRPARFANFSWHGSVGASLLALLVLRVLWLAANPSPEPLPGASRRNVIARRCVHLLLYVSMFAMALIGWALSGTFRQPLDPKLFGVIDLPALTQPGDRALHEALESWHGLVAWPLAILIGLHVLAALYHLCVKRDGLVQRMLPRRSSVTSHEPAAVTSDLQG